ncbi:MAG: hypothetical protein EHM24_33325 [Acidobacteria bacterium]|nr:MAG: hypothetical protein EHM24_33325 [Acidobacteriota bacterium]
MAIDRGSLENSGRMREDRFFLEQDRILVEKLRELRKVEETKQALSEVSGITNQAVLQKLIDLDIHAETVASLAVVPLVEIAWADGRIEDKERAAIMEASAQGGLAKGSPDSQILERWLSHRPGPELLEAWTHYVQGLCEMMGADEREALRRGLLDRARRVAEAAGGFLGLTSGISKSEQRVLDTLEKAFAG